MEGGNMRTATVKQEYKNYIALTGGKLIDGNGGPPLENASLIVKGKNIEAVGTRDLIKIPPEAKIIDATGKTIMPGMTDMHVHLYWNGEPDLALHTYKESTAFRAVKAVAYIQRSLEAGFTTLRSGGELGYLDVALRDAVDMGIIWGSRVVASGYSISGTGGHADRFPPWLYRTDEVRMLADGPDACIKAVRQQIKMKVDWIKFHASGGVMDPFSSPQLQEYSDGEIEAIVNEAHARGKPAFAHAQGAGGIRAAVRGGVNSIEHGFYLEDDIIEMMLKKGTYLVPTLVALYRIIEAGERGGIPRESITKAIPHGEAHVASFQKAYRAGIKICMGTDCGSPYNYHGDNAYEFFLMVKHGMKEMDALISCTKRSAEALGMSDKMGTLEKGKWADVLVVEGNPLEDIQVLVKKKNIKLVMKEGKIYFNRILGAG
jgi:imidazolonepropionase-like amidohydrolase